MMLVFTCLWSIVVFESKDLQVWILDNLWLFYVSLVMVVGISLAMTCHYRKFRPVPINYITLAAYTVFHSYLVGALLPYYDEVTILMAAGCTLGMFIALTAYACFTKKDLTYMGGALSVGSLLVLCFLMVAFIYRNKVIHMAICCVVILLTSFWIIYDT